MRKTTITVAAFMAVAAASYAAVTPGNNGYEFTVAKGRTDAIQQFSLKKGTYSITVSEGTIAVDGAALAGDLVVDAAKEVTIKVTLDAQAGDGGKKVTLKIVPTTEAWTTWLADQQTIITNLMSEASNLGKGEGDDRNEDYMSEDDKKKEAGWRTDLISRISDIQKAKNNCGIEEYNEWVDKGSVTSLAGLKQLKSDVNDKTANHNAYKAAIKAFSDAKETGGKLDYSNLTTKYNSSAAKDYFTTTYNSLKGDIDGVEEAAWKVYIAGNAAANYDAQKLSTKISDLKSRIDNLSTAITNGSTQYANWSEVDGAVKAAIAFYNTQFNGLYSQLAAETLPKGYGKDIYNDYYENAVKDLNAILAKIYAVKNANDAAKKAYDDATTDNKPAINGLNYYKSAEWTGAGNAEWEDDKFQASLAAVYAKYITTGTPGANGVIPAGDKDATEISTLRGAYRAHVATIASLKSSLSAFNAAKADTDKDKDGKVIGTYFTSKVDEITNLITTLEGKVNNSNKAHTITSFNIDTEGKTGIDTKKSFLDTQKGEYVMYVATRNTINTLENTTFANAKTVVNGKNYHDFNASERFSKAAIETAIANFKTAARNNYKVENGNGMAAAYNSVTCGATKSTIETQINTWKTAAINAYDKYKAIYDAMAAYDLEISGRAAAPGVVAIESWASVVLNENVTVGNVVPSADTYGSRKVAADLVKNTAKGLLDKAMEVAKNDATKENDFVTKLDAAFDEKANVISKTTEIQTLKGQYATDAPVWQAKTSHQAAKDAKAESQSLKGACQTVADAIETYAGNDYGTAAAATLNAETTRIKNVLATIQGAIDAVVIPDSYDDPSFTQDKAATAIAQINEIKVDLAVVEADIKKLTGTTAPAAKTNFTEVKNAIDNIKNHIIGRPAAQGVTEIASISDLLYPETNATITDAITTLNNAATKLLTDLNDAPVVADARKDKPAEGENPKVDGLDTRCKNLLESVNDYRTKATNESNNKKNKDAWDAFLLNPYGVQNPQSSDAAQSIINANKDAIDNALAGDTSDGESYFQGLISNPTTGKQKLFDDIKLAVTNLYTTKLAAPNSAFTDPANNLTDAKLAKNKQDVLAILNEVKTYPGKAKDNEDAYKAQGDRYTEVLSKYNDLRLEISAAKPSGDKFTESYNNTLAKLTEINDALAKYNTDRDTKYAEGGSEAFDAKATLSNINAINDKITTLSQKWSADETTDGSYLKAVADDNNVRYNAFLTALDALKEAYYGKTVGTVHTDGAIDIVSKLSSLSYADQVDPQAYADLVDGTDGLYQYAAKISALASEASANKEATKAPAFWDMDGTFATRANDMKTNKVVSKKDAYAALVNNIAKSTYITQIIGNDQIIGVVSKLEAARTALKASGVELAADDEKANALIDAVKSTNSDKKKGAVAIYNEAVEAYNGGTPVADFAYRLDKEFLPGFAEFDQLIADAKDKAAKESWEVMCAKVNTTTDATDMQAFMWNPQYSIATNLTTFVKGAAPTDFAFNDIEYDNTFDGYAAAKSAYVRCVTTRIIATKDETHTNEYWAAYDSNEKYNSLFAADQALQAAISTLTANLDAAEEAIKSLLVEHDENLATLIGTYRNYIDGLNNASGEAAIQTAIDNLNGMAIHKEEQAVNIELTNMRKYIELNVEEAKRAELIAKVDDLQNKNEIIYNLFNIGTGTPLVKASAADTYAKYQAIEKEIGALKSSFDTTVANAAAEVAAAIAELDGKYSEFETLYNSTFTQTQDHYANDKSAVKAQIANLKAKVAAQGDAISIEKTNNLKAVEKAEKAIETLSAAVTAYNQGYVDNDNFVKGQLALIKEYKADLADVVTKGNDLKNKKQQWGELYVVIQERNILNNIDGYDVWNGHVDGAVDLLDKLIEYVKDGAYNAKKRTAIAKVEGIKNDITDLEKEILKYDLNTESDNVEAEINALQAEIENRIPEGAGLRDDLTYEVSIQIWNKDDLDSHKNEVVAENGYWDNGLKYWSIVAEHQNVMDDYKAILDALSDIDDRIVTPGAIGDKETVTSDDIESMIRFILNPSEAEGKLDVADIDNDKKVTVADLTKVKNYYLYHNYAGYTPSSSAVRAYPTAVVAGSLDMAVNGSFLNVSLDTQVGYAAIQLDVTLPAGVVLTDAAFAGATEGVQAMYNKIGENTWRVLLFSEDNSNLVDGTDLLSLGLAGKGYGNVNIGNAMGSNTRGILIPIPGDSDDIDISTGIEAPAEIAGGNSFFYGINAAMQRSFEKGVNIVKEAGKKAIKVLQRK